MTDQEPKQKRGRPRSETTRVKIMKATAAILKADGLPGVTIEAVAVRAGVGKPTIYRYWANANELAMAALMETAPRGTVAGDTDAPLTRLQRILHRIAETFSHATGRFVATMLASAHEDSEVSKAFRSHFIRARRLEALTELKAARTMGHVRPNADIELALDMLFGAVFYRLLMNQAPLDAAYMDDMFAMMMAGLKP